VVTRPRPRTTRVLVVLFVSLSLAVITLDYRQGPDGPLEHAGRAVKSAMAPLQEGVTTATRPIGDFFSGLAHLPSLERENQDLKNQLAETTTAITEARNNEERLAELQALLGIQQTLDPNAVAAVVIANGISNLEWTITINKGSSDGIDIDMPVVTGSTTSDARLVGRVIDVTSHSADVQLVIDRAWKGAGVLGGMSETGLVIGQGDQDLRMDGISPNAEIDLAQHPQVFTLSYSVHGQQGLYPPGILIGDVSRVFQGSNELQTSVSIRPAVDFSALEYVLVLTTRTRKLDQEAQG
jgi:rod shape-determining protein MreC